MLEFERREQHLLSGLGVQILIVGLLVFAYTQAFRQLKRERQFLTTLQEQLTMAREEVARQTAAGPQRVAWEARARELAASWVSPDQLTVRTVDLKRAAEEVFFLRGVRMEVPEVPLSAWRIPLEGRDDLEILLYPVEMTGSGATADVSALVEALSRQGLKPLQPLTGMELRASSGEAAAGPIEFTLRWLIPVSRTSLPGVAAAAAPAPAPLVREGPAPPPGRGSRWEPFVSPLVSAAAMRVSPDRLAPFRLSGILWEPEHPSCVVNGTVLKPGDWIGEHQVVLITPQAVLLQGKGEEILLRQQ